MRRLYRVRAAVHIVACGAIGSHAALAQDVFTVRDSIEMTRILNLSGEDQSGNVAWYAPDGAHFVIHARRGDLARNRSVESLLLFTMPEVRRYLAERDRGSKPLAKTLVQLDIEDDWGELSSIQWLNHREVGFLAQGEDGVNQAFVANVDGRVTQLTRSATPVASFAASQDAILYYAHVSAAALPLVTSLEERGIGDLLFLDDAISTPVVLFQASRSGSGARRLPVPAAQLFDNRIWISPSGQCAVSFTPIVAAPKRWAEYRLPKHLLGEIQERAFQLRYQLIDLKHGSVRNLLDAPAGLLYGNRTPAEVFWPRDGRSVIVSNTYLPLDGATRAPRREGPAIAEIDLETGRVTPIVFEPVLTQEIQAHKVRLTPIVSIEWNDEHGVLTITKRSPLGETTRESYQKHRGAWRSVGNPGALDAAQPQIERRESLNERPKIYAAGGACTCTKVLLDPAPQADRFTFGRAEVFKWTDANGIEWQGGLIRPPDFNAAKRYPLIVQTHGFNPNEFLIDGPYGATTAMAAQALANAGFLVLQVEDNRRATTLDEKEAPRYAEGYRAAIAKLIEHGRADSARVGLISFSRTVRHTIQLMADHPDLLAAVTFADGSWWGYMNELFLANRSPALTSHLRRLRSGTPAEMGLADWLASDPIYRLPKSRTAVRIEAIGPGTVLGMWEQYAVLREANRPVDFIYFPEGSHVLKKPLERLGSQGGNVDWFRFWLRGEEDPNSSKVEQYKRWRALRLLPAGEGSHGQ